MIKCSSRNGLLTRLLVFQPAYGCSPFPPCKGSLSWLPEILSHALGIRRPSRLNDSALWPRWIFNEIDDVSIGIRLFAFPAARGFALSSARDYLPRPGNPLWPRWILNEIDDVSIGTRLFAFPTARGFTLSSARDSLPRPGNPLWPRLMMIKCSSEDGLLTRLLVFQPAYGCSPFPPLEGSRSSLPEILSPARGIRSGRDE